MEGPLELIPTQDSLDKREITLKEGIERPDTSQLIFCALNPIKGWRKDEFCTAYRNFLIEVDDLPIKEQLPYIRKVGLPYSAAVFSGGKSIHFLVSLQEDLPSEKVYRYFAEWILKVVSLADDKTKNPSRSIRIPGAWRSPTQKQRLVEIKGPTKLSDLVEWLKKHPECKPKLGEKRVPSGNKDFNKIKPWVKKELREGIDPSKGRNQRWFAIACEFALAGYSEDDTIDILSEFFSPDSDFKDKEWRTAINSGFKHIYARK